MIELRAGALYRVEIQPRHAEVMVRERAREGSPAQPVVTMPLVPGDSAPDGARASAGRSSRNSPTPTGCPPIPA